MMTSIFSAGNTYTYAAVRSLYGLSLEGRAPKFLRYTTKKGVPLWCFCVVMAFPFLSFLATSNGAESALSFISTLVTAGGPFAPFVANLFQSSLTAYYRYYRLHRHEYHVSPLPRRLQSPRVGSQILAVLWLLPAVLCLVWPLLVFTRYLILRLLCLSQRPTLVN